MGKSARCAQTGPASSFPAMILRFKLTVELIDVHPDDLVTVLVSVKERHKVCVIARCEPPSEPPEVRINLREIKGYCRCRFKRVVAELVL